MAASTGNAPSWLFSFVDLAFLLLIAMTQVGGDVVEAPVLGEIVVPRIESGSEEDLPTGASDRWQVRVHPPDADAAEDAAPFELAPANAPEEGERLGAEALRQRLAELRDQRTEKPLLAPHQDSRSQDLLDALAAIEDLWPGRRRATVTPVVAQR